MRLSTLNIPDQAPEINTLKQFRDACKGHDLTYMYSDDFRWYHAGTASIERINEAAKKFKREDVVRIWNETVDEKIMNVKGYREQFYWKV